MLLSDVYVLLYAHVEDSVPDHSEYATWITKLPTGPEPFALSVLVLSGFIRIVTIPRVFDARYVDTVIGYAGSQPASPILNIVVPH